MPVEASALEFAAAARRLAGESRARGLSVPAFRSPPGVSTAQRTIRRRPDGGVVVAVRVRGRTLPAVIADMVEGVLRANGLTGDEAEELRAALAEAADEGSPARPEAA